MNLKTNFITILSLSCLIAGCQSAPIEELVRQDLLKRQGSKEFITTAFGIELGSQFNIDNSRGTVIDEPDGYVFEPTVPYEDFTTYYVIRAPKSGIVSEIHAYSDKMSEDACKNRLRTLQSIYYEKYLYAGEHLDDDYNKYRQYIDADNGYLRLGCTGFVEYRLYVDYGDLDLIKITKDERLAIEKESKDKSGL
ncbi:MAG: hypothetical protein H6912_03235 [Kordiimonadaceae bacterium]|nr:hypothetical protein [Kordiimonadaceae bacterium]